MTPVLVGRYWTHHDKVVVVDQKLAFLGGVDLCYGRYDNWRHQLSDRSEAAEALWPGDDFYNPCAAEAVTTTRFGVVQPVGGVCCAQLILFATPLCGQEGASQGRVADFHWPGDRAWYAGGAQCCTATGCVPRAF